MSTAILEWLKNLSFLSVGLLITLVGSFTFMDPCNSMVPLICAPPSP